ncbi:MAG TPA: phosphoribosyltransferase family protein [Longimicrobiales bacterium]
MYVRNFTDRADAGRQLAEALQHHVHLDDPLVLGLARGGVTVAAEVARALGAELDVMVVRKLGHPLQPELAIGAIGPGGVRVVNAGIASGVPSDVIDSIARREEREMERRERLYRASGERVALRDRNVLLVDDGLATGATMLAAVRAARAAGAHRVIVAVPIADPAVCASLGREADRVLCLVQPALLGSIGGWYDEFPQLTDDDVRAVLHEARRSRAASQT